MIHRHTRITILLILAALSTGYFLATRVNGYLKISISDKEPVSGRVVPGAADSSLSAIPLRMVDLGGVGVPPDSSVWGSDYSHNQRYFEDVWLPYSPFVRPAAFDREEDKLRAYAGKMAGYGYNAIAFPWFLECVNFDLVDGGNQVYGPESIYRIRHDTLSARIGRLMEVAAGEGLSSYLWTDMVALTPPLVSYFRKRYGSVDVENPALWEIYSKAAEELFSKFPLAEGIILRIGEAGSIYNQPGWDYTSELLVRTPGSLRLMLEAFLKAADARDRQIIFRTWSVGVGEIGDMHTNPDTYSKVLGGIRSDHLLVSTKYSSGDFYSWLPLNSTLNQGPHRRVAEFQAKREYEGFGALPNYVAPLHRAAIRSITGSHSRLDGIWVWTQYGGPVRAGPMIIYPFHGFNVINDANTFALGNLAMDPAANLDTITHRWIRGMFGSDSLVVDHVRRFLYSSHDLIKKGLYISEFARYDVKALGLEPPPMMWIFEWDILSASSAVFSQIYHIGKSRFGQMTGEGVEAVRGSLVLRDLLLEAFEAVEKNRDSFDALISSVDYQVDLFRLLDYYRQYMLHYYRWVDTGDPSSASAYKLAMGQFRAVRDYHEQKYKGNLNTLGMDFREAEKGIRLAEHTDASVRWARVAVILTFFLLLMGIPGFIRDRAHRKFAGTLFFDAVFRPYRVTALNDYHGTAWLAGALAVLYALSLVVFSGFISVIFPLAVGIPGLLVPVLLSILLDSGRDRTKIFLSLMAPKVMTVMLLTVIVSVRGPVYFWFMMWTSGIFRFILFMAFSLLLFRKLQVYIVLGRKWSRHPSLRPGIMTALALGIQILLVGAVLLAAGMEQTLTALNDDLLLLPGGLSRILGITTHLGIPGGIPVWLAGIGSSIAALSLLALLMLNSRARRRRVS